MCSSIQLCCPMCGSTELETPEELCEHVARAHDHDLAVRSGRFDSYVHFQIWLSSIEETRSDGGYIGSDEGPSYEGEYYLLCRRKPSIGAKRRRLSEEFVESNTVTCSAFVHVVETLDGCVSVQYCLEHCGHCEDDRSEEIQSTRSRKRVNLKRSSPCISDDHCDDDCHCETSSKSGSLSPSPSIYSPIREDDVNHNVIEDGTYDLSSLNTFITERLDTTADRLRALTKVLAELAVDIKKCDDRQCTLVI
ncbi:unnamed protein product [Caenorhabditis auriculariae]|uniref:C2H2-type domain-containing protein n=1 Tax=Caenorhabditis auriculariae TaxID=2777116 RepID=A0A8S1GQN5_9PELO|nr:unnamed protein product [Caenorhabditis auriculariae]